MSVSGDTIILAFILLVQSVLMFYLIVRQDRLETKVSDLRTDVKDMSTALTASIADFGKTFSGTFAEDFSKYFSHKFADAFAAQMEISNTQYVDFTKSISNSIEKLIDNDKEIHEKMSAVIITSNKAITQLYFGAEERRQAMNTVTVKVDELTEAQKPVANYMRVSAQAVKALRESVEEHSKKQLTIIRHVEQSTTEIALKIEDVVSKVANHENHEKTKNLASGGQHPASKSSTNEGGAHDHPPDDGGAGGAVPGEK